MVPPYGRWPDMLKQFADAGAMLSATGDSRTIDGARRPTWRRRIEVGRSRAHVSSALRRDYISPSHLIEWLQRRRRLGGFPKALRRLRLAECTSLVRSGKANYDGSTCDLWGKRCTHETKRGSPNVGIVTIFLANPDRPSRRAYGVPIRYGYAYPLDGCDRRQRPRACIDQNVSAASHVRDLVQCVTQLDL